MYCNTVGLDMSDIKEWAESDVRGYFPCCPLCGNKEIAVYLIDGGRDTLTCRNCNAKWHIHVGLSGLKWAELDVDADDGKGKELLGRRIKKNEWRKMAHETRKKTPEISSVQKTGNRTELKATIEKEIIKEKEVIIKIRCSYCRNIYDESLDKCPYCSGKR